MTLGTMGIPGVGAVLGITADGTTRGTGILGTTADGMVAGTVDGTTRGITEDGGTDRTTSMTVTSSVRAAAEYTRQGCPQPVPPEEAASAPHQGALE